MCPNSLELTAAGLFWICTGFPLGAPFRATKTDAKIRKKNDIDILFRKKTYEWFNNVFF
jgi:hypothetical protein